MTGWIGVASFNVGAALLCVVCCAGLIRDHLRDKKRSRNIHPTYRQDQR